MWVVSCGPISRLSQKNLRTPCWNGFSYKKGSLGKDILCVGMLVGLLLALIWWAASALLGLASLPSTSWCGLCQWPDWSPYQLSARAHVPWDCSWSLQGHEPDSATSSTSGSLKRIFAVHDWRGAMCWLVLGGPWKACSQLHKIGQSPTRRFSRKNPQLVGILVCLEAVISLTWKQICKYAKEHLGTFFSDGVFWKFFMIILAPEPPEYANVQIRRWPFPPYLSVKLI